MLQVAIFVMHMYAYASFPLQERVRLAVWRVKCSNYYMMLRIQITCAECMLAGLHGCELDCYNQRLLQTCCHYRLHLAALAGMPASMSRWQTRILKYM